MNRTEKADVLIARHRKQVFGPNGERHTRAIRRIKAIMTGEWNARHIARLHYPL